MKSQLGRVLCLFFLTAVLYVLSACGGVKSGEQDKTTISMYLYDKSMMKELTPWLEERFPEVEFVFTIGYNSMDFIDYLWEHDELPDIITCRRFSLNEAAHMSECLMDLSQTELVGTFYSSYIENNRENTGAIRWLPMCAEIDGIVANRELFEKNNIPIPTNYQEFVQACQAFEKLGIDGFHNDYSADYSCLEAIQGSAIPELMSLAGRYWRASYESELVDGTVSLDDKVWPVVFQKFEQFLKDTDMQPEELNRVFKETVSQFQNGKVAMFRATGNDCMVSAIENHMDAVMLPYFGETKDDNWLLTYPVFQVAVNRDVEQDDMKKDLVMRVLNAMFSDDGQHAAANGATVLSYNKTMKVDIPDNFVYVADCIEENHLYQRLASTEFFSISKNVAKKMIQKEYDAMGAYEDFAVQLTTVLEPKQNQIVATLEHGYENTFTQHGSQAASALVNTLRRQLGTDLFVGYSYHVTSSVYPGDYTAQQLQWLIHNRVSLRRGVFTGKQIVEIMEWLVNSKEDGSNPIRHRTMLPVVSGMEYTVQDCGDGTYHLGEVTINGEPIQEKDSFSVILMGDDNVIEAELFCNCPMPETIKGALEAVEGPLWEHLADALLSGRQPELPTEYVTVYQ